MQQVNELLRRTGGTISHLSTKWSSGYTREVAGLVELREQGGCGGLGKGGVVVTTFGS